MKKWVQIRGEKGIYRGQTRSNEYFSEEELKRISVQMSSLKSISVIVPCYNVEKELPRCIDSLLRQTIPVDIILINDGSTDGTLKVAEEYASANSNVHIITQKNAGLPQARKVGVEHISSKYVGFVDADDWVEPDMYEMLMDALEKTDADISCCNFYYSYPGDRNILGSKFSISEKVIDKSECINLLCMRKAVFPYMWNKLFRYEIISEAVFPMQNFIGEDFVTLLPLLDKVSTVSLVRKPLYHYWSAQPSMSRGCYNERHQISFERYQNLYKWFVEIHPSLSKALRCYLSVEYMSFIIAMSRCSYYDKPVIKSIVTFIRNNIVTILKSELSVSYKGAALSTAINYRLLILAYCLINMDRANE